MSQRNLWPHFCEGNAIALLEGGAAYFPALGAAIDAARQEVLLETYIFADDAVGRAIAAALRRAAARGVSVHLLVDGFGCRAFVRTRMQALRDAGVNVLVYRRELQPFALRRHRLRRLHRKLAVIDRRVAFVGGINLVDDHNTDLPTYPRHDYAVRVEGPLLRPLHSSARHLWELVSWASLKRRARLPDAPLPQGVPAGEMCAALVIRDNLRHRRDIENAYLDALAQARHEVIIANAYFLPGRRFRQALMAAAARGVRVTLLVQGQVEYALQHFATQALYPALLNAGVRVFEYRRSFLHAKVAVIDTAWATVGSSNIDPFSLLLAREANVVVRDAGFAAQLRTRLLAAIDRGAIELRIAQWRIRSPLARALHWLAYGLVRVAVGLVGYGRGHDPL